MLKRNRWLALTLMLGLSIVSANASAQMKTVPFPRLYPDWFLQPKDLGALSWDDTQGDGAGGLVTAAGDFAFSFTTSLSDVDLISRVERWAHAQNYELIRRTGDTKLDLSEFDLDKNPAVSGRLALERGHVHVIGVEMGSEHHVAMMLYAGNLR
jgi:hypothetical protein